MTSNLGLDQCIQARDTVLATRTDILDTFTMVFSSSAPRALITSVLYTAGNSQVFIKPVKELYDASMTPEGVAMYRLLQNQPLDVWLCHEDDDVRGKAHSVLGHYVQESLDAMTKAWKEEDFIFPGDAANKGSIVIQGETLLVVTHSVYLSALALALAHTAAGETATTADEAAFSACWTKKVGEVEGFVIDLDTGAVEFLPCEA